MTQVSRGSVQKLATLSNIRLTDDEIESLRTDLSRILEYVEQLNELDTTDIEPAYQVTGLENIYRDDVVEQAGVDRETLLALAPETKDDQVKVPKVI